MGKRGKTAIPLSPLAPEVVAIDDEGGKVLPPHAHTCDEFDPPILPVLRRTARTRLDCLLQVANRKSLDM